ncbi:hypothetical protein EDB84DRAFT_1567747 [Lactarius hengduanensis]|nr:hypothetical protein EDB84DRAFT_1567747 [Lactarius hengduanensis]
MSPSHPGTAYLMGQAILENPCRMEGENDKCYTVLDAIVHCALPVPGLEVICSLCKHENTDDVEINGLHAIYAKIVSFQPNIHSNSPTRTDDQFDMMGDLIQIRGLVPTEDHLSVLADVMDGVHMICGLVPTEDHLSIPADVMDGVQQPFHSFHEKTVALGWNFNDCGFIERDCVVFIDCHFVVVELVPLNHPSANLRRERPTSLVVPRRATLSFPCASHPRKLQIMFVIVTTSLASLALPSSPH